jgi:hypothetical protein
MATYDELLAIATTGTVFISRLRVAAVIAAEKVRTEADTVTNHANRLKWAKTAFQDSESTARDLLWIVLAQNRGATSAAILAATDATIQTAVDAAIDVLAQG